MINDLFDYTGSQKFSAREKAALNYADLFKQGEHAIDKDEVYAELAKHFSDEEIIELGPRRSRWRRQVRQIAQRAELGGSLRDQSQAQGRRSVSCGGINRQTRPSVTQGYMRVARLSPRECPVPEDKPTLRGHRGMSPFGPSLHLIRCPDMSAIRGKPEVARTRSKRRR
jgi:hypothetical protein